MSKILTQDVGMNHILAKVVLWPLLPEQKEHHAEVDNDLIQTTTNKTYFLKKVITLKGTEASLSYSIMFLVSCICFNKCLQFSYYVAGYFLDRLHMILLMCCWMQFARVLLRMFTSIFIWDIDHSFLSFNFY